MPEAVALHESMIPAARRDTHVKYRWRDVHSQSQRQRFVLHQYLNTTMDVNAHTPPP